MASVDLLFFCIGVIVGTTGEGETPWNERIYWRWKMAEDTPNFEKQLRLRMKGHEENKANKFPLV